MSQIEIPKIVENKLRQWDKATLAAPFIWNEAKIVDCINRMYELYDLKKPRSFVKTDDPFDKKFLESASLASRASWASWASSASLASANYDLPEYLHTLEFTSENAGNNHDAQLLQYADLMLEALQNGLGYYTEHEGQCYIAPHPKVMLDDENNFHSLSEAAISWKNGFSGYFLFGVNFQEEPWRSVVSQTISAKDVMLIPNVEQRIVAMKILGGDRIIAELGGKKFSEDAWGELWTLDIKDSIGDPYVFFRGKDPSKGNGEFFERVPPSMKTPQKSQEWAYRLSRFKMAYQPSIRT